MSYQRILVATDGSEPANAATEEAITLAKRFDADLYALYVLEAAEPPREVDDPATRPGVDTKAEQALTAVTDQAVHRGYEKEIVTVTVRGQTSDAIVTYAEENDIDLIVIGTHGRRGLDRVVMGSVAESVVRTAPAPVLTVRPTRTTDRDRDET